MEKPVQGSFRRLLFCGATIGRLVYARRGSSAIAAAIALTTGSAASAQNAPPDAPAAHSRESPITVDAVVVTAGKREQKLLDLGQSVAAFSSTTLQTRGVQTLTDLDKVVPGLTFSNTQGGEPVPTLRGVGFSEFSLDATPDVTVYVDQFPLVTTALTKGASLDLERLEVLKGPQGTLFGENATGGAINYVTAQPTRSFEAGGDVTYARFNRVDVNGYVSGPLTDTLSARLAFHTEQGGAWQKNYAVAGSPMLGNRNLISGRILLDWRPTDRFKSVFSFTAWQDGSDGTAGAEYGAQLTPGTPIVDSHLYNFPLAPRNPQAAGWDPLRPPKNNDQFYSANLRTDYKLSGDVTLTNLVQYVDAKISDRLDSDGTDADDVNYLQTGSTDSFYEEMRLSNGSTNRLRWIVGVNYENDKITQQTNTFDPGNNTAEFYSYLANNYILAHPGGFPGSSALGCPSSALTIPIGSSGGQPPQYPAPCLNFPGNLNYGRDLSATYAAFGNIEYDLFTQLTLKGGVRFTQEDITDTSCTKPTNSTTQDASDVFTAIYREFGLISQSDVFSATQCTTINESDPADMFSPYHGKLNQSNVPWHVGVDWKPIRGVLVYANVSQGYKGGGFPVAVAASTSKQLEPYSQESLLSYEIGVKAQVNRSVVLQAAGFYYDYSDKQVLNRIEDPLFGPLQAVVNIPKSSILGTEAEIDWTSSFGLSANVTASYLDTKVVKFIGLNANGTPGNFAGSPLPFTPKWSLSGDISYQWDLPRDLVGIVGAHASYRSTSYDSIGPAVSGIDTIKGYTLLDLRAGIKSRDGAIQLTVWGRNVTNAYYVQSQGLNYDTYVRYVGMPATYGATFAYKFR